MSAPAVLVELGPWLQLLLVPAVGLLVRIEGRLSRLEERSTQHQMRLQTLERRAAGWS
ncbi:MAG: hypothetical protein RIQ53_2843 [Pseudomonadota bacterium]